MNSVSVNVNEVCSLHSAHQISLWHTTEDNTLSEAGIVPPPQRFWPPYLCFWWQEYYVDDCWLCVICAMCHDPAQTDSTYIMSRRDARM